MTDPKPYTVEDVNLLDNMCSVRAARLLATAQAAAEADSLRTQLEEAQRQLTDGRRLTEKLIAERDEAQGVRDAAIGVQNRLHIAREKDTAALTAAQGGVVVLRETAQAFVKAACARESRVPVSEAVTTTLSKLNAALASTKATADAHDERVEHAFSERVIGRIRAHFGRDHSGHGEAAVDAVSRALAHPTKEPK